MSTNHSLFFASLALSALCHVGCGGITSTSTSDNGQKQLVPEQCSSSLTTLHRSMNGRQLQSLTMPAGTVSQITKNCNQVANLHLEGSTLVGTWNGQPMRGADFVGTTVVQVDPNGAMLSAVISDVQVDTSDPTKETLLYSLQSLNPIDGSITEVCAPDAEGKRFAIPVPGSWDKTGAHQRNASAITFGCTSAAIGKCVRLGYRPWAKVNGVSMEGHHQACTRMIRFDYCGDGVSHTADGTEIDVYDSLKINTRDALLLSPFDAAWSEDGAYCVERQRWIRLSTVDGLTLQALLPTACLNKFELTLAETSPIDPLDLCTVRSKTISRSAVLLDNRSGVNISLQ